MRITKTNTILKRPMNKLFAVENTYYDTNQTDKASHRKIASPLPLLSCESWIFVKENPDRKKANSALQFVIFKLLSYCFEETIEFDVKASFPSRLVSRLIRWYNKPGDITKEFWQKTIQFHGTFHELKITNCLQHLRLWTDFLNMMGEERLKVLMLPSIFEKQKICLNRTKSLLIVINPIL